MNQLSKLIIAATTIGSFLSLPLGETLVQAQDAAFLQCVQQYTNLGVSPDAALAQCQKSNLAECVQRLISKKYVAKSVSQSNGRYLVDLGVAIAPSRQLQVSLTKGNLTLLIYIPLSNIY